MKKIEVKINSNKQGFTIIEVVLVLAIAGFIFLAVFLALPSLQKSERDEARRSVVGRMVAATLSYKTNSGGEAPANGKQLEEQVLTGGYAGSDIVQDYYIHRAALPEKAAVKFKSGDKEPIFYKFAASCADGWIDASSTSTRSFAVAVVLEGGGTYCAEG